MAYSRTTWEDSPSTATPLNSVNLNKIEAGLVEAAADADTAQAAASAAVATAAADATSKANAAQAAAIAASQPADSDLLAIAALTTTAYGRAFLALADAAAGRTSLGLGTAATSAATAFETAGTVTAHDLDELVVHGIADTQALPEIWIEGSGGYVRIETIARIYIGSLDPATANPGGRDLDYDIHIDTSTP